MEALWKRRRQVRPVAWHRLATRPGPPSGNLPSRPTTQPGREGSAAEGVPAPRHNHCMADSRITVRLSAEQSRKLDALAAAASTTKAQALRRLIDGADSVAEQDVEPFDVEGVRRLLSEQARRGSVPAAKALLEHQWRFEKERQADAELDQLNALGAGR